MANRRRKHDRDKLSPWGDLAETMRFVLYKKHGPLSVSQTTDVPDPIDGNTIGFTEVVVRVNLPNPKVAVDGPRLLPVQRYREFFESWRVQREFLLWLGMRLAESIPSNGDALKYKRKFARLTSGRPSKLPSRLYLRRQYEIVVAQIRAARAGFINRERHVDTNTGRQEILTLARKNGFEWLHLIKDDKLNPADIMVGKLQGAAQYVLSLQYGVSEEAVRSKLFRNG